VRSIRTVDILGLPVHALTPSAFVEMVDASVRERACRSFVGVNAHSLSLAHEDPAYLERLRETDVLYAEGGSIVLASWLLRDPLPAKLTTTDLWPLCCDLACREGYTLYLLGGEAGLAGEAAAAARRKWKSLRILGTHHGYFDADEEKVIRDIDDVRPDLLWVGLGEPKQVDWAHRNRTRLHAGALLTCGGMFRLIAGRQRRPGLLLHRTGFEWVGRIFHEPAVARRYGRDLPLLALRVLRELMARKQSR
jgi:N-acetylglucosaminyldiphosphoundecaprenol N-acetyl-beta-D-mannosaminyltransferase